MDRQVIALGAVAQRENMKKKRKKHNEERKQGRVSWPALSFVSNQNFMTLFLFLFISISFFSFSVYHPPRRLLFSSSPLTLRLFLAALATHASTTPLVNVDTLWPGLLCLICVHDLFDVGGKAVKGLLDVNVVLSGDFEERDSEFVC